MWPQRTSSPPARLGRAAERGDLPKSDLVFGDQVLAKGGRASKAEDHNGRDRESRSTGNHMYWLHSRVSTQARAFRLSVYILSLND